MKIYNRKVVTSFFILIIFFLLLTVGILPSNNLNAQNTCLDFDGVDDYVESKNVVIPASGDFTVSVWAKLDGSPASGYREILSQNAGTGGSPFYIGFVYGSIRAGDWWENTGVAYPTDGDWHFFTFVKTSTNAYCLPR